ncbi:preprotein translocase subunit SecA [Candidatus Saccharibacteria bacterium]|nr:preprotein translocase subunit SecA [Candidatus Saccharibacteria bacterium]
MKREKQPAGGARKKPTDKLADRSAKTRFLQHIFGDAQKATLKRLEKRVSEINALEEKFKKMKKKELQGYTEVLKEKLKKKGVTLETVLPEAFALVREASVRVLGMRHFDVQMVGGIALHEGRVAEMKTGEGKTLVATLPLYLNALLGRGVHLVTVNDYLVQHQAGWMGELYDFLGMTTGVISHDTSYVYEKDFENPDFEDPYMKRLRPASRKEAYAADITYGTNNEYGFDYLRDNMVNDAKLLRQRDLYFAIVDEVDSILIDEARTPLIISAPAAENPQAYYQFAQVMKILQDEDYLHDEKRRNVTLTDSGVEKLERILGVTDLYNANNVQMIYHIEQALRAEVVFRRDKDYVVTNDGEVLIVDEHTGRVMSGRRYSEGLHQAIEAKEAVEVKQESRTLATVSFQNFFRLYEKLSGMTGTAFTEAEEFQQIYALDVVQIPTNKPITRVDEDDLIFKTELMKMKAVADEVKKFNEQGRPVLVGSASIVKNEMIADFLRKEGVEFEILNAKNNEREAAIIAKAGQKGAVTLATNMAGRGTDIKLGDGVRELGGLVVIGSERHESRRIDNQLRGRGGRQGDPGTTQFFVSTEDDLMRIFQGERLAAILGRLGITDDMPIQARAISRTLESAQKRVEGFHFDARKNVVQYDNVINRHRKVVYTMRRRILDGEDLQGDIRKLLRQVVEDLVAIPAKYNPRFTQDFRSIFNADAEMIGKIGKIKRDKERMEMAEKEALDLYRRKEVELGEDIMRPLEREVYLSVLDSLWMQHLENMQHLREGIHWRSVGQRDPLVEYRSESQKMFTDLQRALRETIVKLLLSATRQEAYEAAGDEDYESELTRMAGSAVDKGVNEVGSGKKVKDKDFKEGEVVKKAAGSGAVGAASGRKKKSGKSGGRSGGKGKSGNKKNRAGKRR